MNQAELVAQVVAQSLKSLGIIDGEQQPMRGRKASGTGVGPYSHGPGGLFSMEDGENPILSAMIQPEGLLSTLPILRADDHVTDFFTTLTGVTAGGTTEPTTMCADPREAGLKKLCTLAIPFGRQRLKTREWNAVRLAKRRDRIEDLAFGAMFPQNLFSNDTLFPMAGVPTQGSSVARTELGNRLFEVAVEFQRTAGPLIYTGDPTNNSNADPNEAPYKEPVGLEIWVNAGNKRDARSSAICTALNSDIKDFAYSDIDGVERDIVDYITAVVSYCKFNARHMRLAPATWRFAMTPDLFEMLARKWPCSYLSNRCANQDGTNIVVLNDESNVRMRDAMMEGSYLIVDGVRYPVVQDMYLPERDWTIDPVHHLPGQYSSDIYFLNDSILGGMRSLGLQYFDQNLTVAANAPTRDNRLWATDAGLFLWNSTNVDLCHDIRMLTEWRLIMLAPQLCGRITNVLYAPMQHKRQWQPGYPYNLDGGVTSQPDEQFYNPWTTTPARF